MTSNKGMGPKKQFWPIRIKLSKHFRRQLTHYAEKFLHELLSNISLINCPTPIGSTKIRPLSSCVISLAQYKMKVTGTCNNFHDRLAYIVMKTNMRGLSGLPKYMGANAAIVMIFDGVIVCIFTFSSLFNVITSTIL